MQPFVRLTRLFFAVALLAQIPGAHGEEANFDVLIKGGTVYDGTGADGRQADVGIRGDRIIAVGNLADKKAANIIDAHGLAVAPGFHQHAFVVDRFAYRGRPFAK